MKTIKRTRQIAKMQNKIEQIKREINLLQDIVFKKRQNLSQNGIKQIAKMQNLLQNELDQIKKTYREINQSKSQK